MALLFLDSCDHYGSGMGTRKWTTGGNITAFPRTGAQSIFGTFAASLTFGPEYRTLAAGTAYQTTGFANNPLKFQGVDGAFVELSHVGDGRLQVDCTAGTSSPSTFVMAKNVWYYLELYCQMVLATGGPGYTRTYNITARVNEATILTATFNDTVGSPLPTIDRGFSQLGLIGSGGGESTYFDDIYLTDGELLGDIKVGVLYPNAPGDSTNWNASPVAANWSNIKEHIPDDDTTIVTAATTGLKDLYNLDDLPGGFAYQIKGVQALWCVKKSDAGPAAVQGVWKSGGVEVLQDKGQNWLSDGYHPSYLSYTYNRQAERKSLFTSSDWTPTEINALQLGLKRVI